MPNISLELKEKLKEQRLSQYNQQIFVLEMDKAALEAVGNTVDSEKAQIAIEVLVKAYNAVEVM